jgi:hypothetical protein
VLSVGGWALVAAGIMLIEIYLSKEGLDQDEKYRSIHATNYGEPHMHVMSNENTFPLNKRLTA